MRFQDFTKDFKISRRFQDFTKDFKISRKISLEVYEISASGEPLDWNARSVSIVCCLSLPRTAKRRILSSPATKHVIPILNEFIERNYPGVSERLVAEGLLLCMPCFRALEGILKIRRQLSDKECATLQGKAACWKTHEHVPSLHEGFHNSLLLQAETAITKS